MEKQKSSFRAQLRSLPANFWYANLMELLERLAFFGVRAVTPLFLVKTASENGLGLDYADKGTIYMVWALIQCLVPMVSGGFTEMYGYRKSLGTAFFLNILGYLAMANAMPIASFLDFPNANFWVFLFAASLVGFGTAVFKPAAHGTVAKATTEETSSFGWGVFYWVVNVGGALAPMAAALLRGEISWHLVFYGAAIVTAANFLPAFLLYKEPEKIASKDQNQDSNSSAIQVLVSSMSTLFKDMRLVVFLLIFSCFWLMFMQVWDLLPNFIDEWVDTSDVSNIFAWFSSGWVLENGQTKPEMIININPMSIILFVIPLSWAISKMNKVVAMIIGMVISLIGFVGAGATPLGWMVCLMLLIFSIGEMTCSPTFSAYVGLIAPPDKKALYMGYSNIPFAIGWALGNKIGGNMYEERASKFKLARQFLVKEMNIPEKEAFDSKVFSNDDVLLKIANTKGLDSKNKAQAATKYLWQIHQPQKVWYYLGVVGLIGTVGMLMFYLFTKKSDSENIEND